MTDWLEYILTLAASREEESEELPELPPEQGAYPVKKRRVQATEAKVQTAGTVTGVKVQTTDAVVGATGQTADTVAEAKVQTALTAKEISPMARVNSGRQLLRMLLQGEWPSADSVPAAILSHGGSPSGMADIGSASENALALLYRRSAEAAESIRLRGIYSGASGQEKVIVVQEAAAASVGLTAGELDRAVRRDSRRYDGGMTIY